ncbi:Beta-ketoacyl synthase OS=Tsukamurella paurometabola (strain ATCC 8368 / DSM / CCUG 35730 /CIP 100753 / JCM 10117 / KCTC 9821 / NBRC 16120 / NCIMB 702349/ NCTC 13040) OX=521096 GN=Tpau_4322 PE=3 SV=1 [Tsukamurella paurometabola]|uniref:Beta-ketoacyl synthase n=1 Tax=Tsukamurella paurometabola (strain ATCC 8368 / DSM 20162 / CCUG 35730 / CIP 100753 / JCM 10117 / KCTC 9821 / NBRC 16120 / NCIMB 702349 / NCTC 13040) TaxID=521096 RepID=D5UZ36_TSUPD|nr:polyketide synthase [Tsukamurella paurometabola]ADG80883.1 Beta-ketoacyl synthase [Tsukamurella paurometabola DSM 20162]SUQ39249.1 Beta-ketoacyl-acyl-carrier-protein synthase I [Tsukamurella paurometabola]
MSAPTAADRIVITGIGLEAPGGVETVEQLWDALETGEDLTGHFPRDRGWDLGEIFALHERRGYQRVPDRGGFLDAAAEFDPAFFGLSPREAIAMDPQQRVALRVAHRALAHAGIAPRSLHGTRTGCYLGASAMEYGPSPAEVNEYAGHRVAGAALGAVAGRIAHHLGTVGPAMTVDAACASSLTALHVAIAGLRSGDCELALVGGVCVMGSPAAFYEFSKNHALAPDGVLHAYGAGAAGTVWGEGAGVLVVETAAHAAAAGRPVLAEVLATRVSHNGGGGPIVVPSEAAQTALVADTLAVAGVDPDDVGMVEGHGTGTPLGDPAELAALATAYGRAGVCWLGSIKSATGHTQAAAGVLGLAKAVLCARAGVVAATLHADPPTPRHDWGAGALALPHAAQPFRPAADGRRIAAVSSFGVAGSNAHALITAGGTQ